MAAQNAFKDKANETLEEKALRVCEVIVSCGLGIRGGQITNGEEMVRVERAVNSVDLYILNVVTAGISDIKKHLDAVSLINAMHGYLISKEKDKIEIAANFARVLIDEHDWQTDSKPVNYDLNAAGIWRRQKRRLLY